MLGESGPVGDYWGSREGCDTEGRIVINIVMYNTCSLCYDRYTDPVCVMYYYLNCSRHCYSQSNNK